MGLKERFMKVYPTIPLGARREIILTLDNGDGTEQPMTWDVAAIEIENDTPISKKILEKLDLLQLI